MCLSVSAGIGCRGGAPGSYGLGQMKFGSVCSGIEAATVAWKPLGWEPQFYSEIDPFPSELLKYRHGNVPNLGDMTKYKEWPDATISLLVGGTPCQSFSVAGLRKGMDDPRGNLALVFLAVADRFRPTWLVWENVPGVLSSNGGRDFGSFLGALGQLGYGWSYRVLNAQYFGVPQRRRRVFVVGYLGDWRRAAAVLFEQHCLHGHSPPSREEGQETSGNVAIGIDEECNAGIEQFGPLLRGGQGGTRQAVATCLTRREAKGPDSDCTNTLIPVAFQSKASTSQSMNPAPVAPTLDVGKADGVAVLTIRTAQTSANGHGVAGDIAHTLDGASGQAVAGFLPTQGSAAKGIGYEEGMQVRRLTPIECERLQGFPDNYTRIPWRGKPAEICPDGPRYKGLGNSMAVPVMHWIGKRIEVVQNLILN